jgi:hypothetical protein
MDDNELRSRWVIPFYHQEPADWDVDTTRAALAEVDASIVKQLLSTRNWRPRQVGGWFVGLKRWEEFGETIGELLLPSELCFAGQGYCFALACLANDVSVRYLVAYLDRYLRQPELYYDQHWAMPALMWVDEQLGTNHSAAFLEPGGLWETFIIGKNFAWDLEPNRQEFWERMHYCRDNFGLEFETSGDRSMGLDAPPLGDPS